MGSIQPLATAGIPHAHVEPMSSWRRGGREFNPTKPTNVSVNDDLWSDFVSRIDPFARKINQGLLTSNVICISIFMIWIFLSWSFPVFNKPFYVMIPIGVVTFALHFGILMRNQDIDKHISDIINELSPQFKAQGHDIQYLKQYTEICKPKGAKAERVIVFPINVSIATSAAKAIELTGLPSATSPSAPENSMGQSVTNEMMADLHRSS